MWALPLLLGAALAGGGGGGAGAGRAALPICHSCEQYCSGRCSLAGPPVDGAPNPRTRQNLTVFRMTAANVTGLANKDTGDAAGDMVFNMGERARPLECRHAAAPSGSMCGGTGTQSWLLQSSLVYLQFVIEVDGSWGPYQPCNLNLTIHSGPGHGQPGDRRWHCGPARVLQKDNMTDAALCRSCPRALAAVGWEDQNHSVGEYAIGGHGRSSAACNATARRLCAAELQTNYSSCRRCVSHVRRNLTAAGCGDAEADAICPPPLPPSTSCGATAQRLCGGYRTPMLRHNCSRCLENASSRLALGGACRESLIYHHWCPAVQRPDYDANTTWIGLRPNPRLISSKLGGSWFSTPAAGECSAGAVPGDDSGCTWRVVQLKKAANYSCVQGHVAAAVMRHNPGCFAACPDGARSDPPDPSDCWLKCFFNTFLGNRTTGDSPMQAQPLLDAWQKSFASEDESAGGCTRLSLPAARDAARLKADDRGTQQRLCVIRPGDDIGAAVAKAASTGQTRCSLSRGLHTVAQPVELPGAFELRGAGAAATRVRSAMPSSRLPASWPTLPVGPGGRPEPLRCVFFANATQGVRLGAMTVDAGLSPARRAFSNSMCGSGTGSDATDPGFERCAFLQGGVQMTGVQQATLDGLVVANASRGLHVVGSAGVAISNCSSLDNGLGSQVSDSVLGSTNVTIADTSFRSSLGHGLFVSESADVRLERVTMANNSWHGLRVVNTSRLSASDLTSSSNGKCGVALQTVKSWSLGGGAIAENTCTGQGGLCIAGNTTDGRVSGIAIVGNGGNVRGSGASRLRFEDVLCDPVSKPDKAWGLGCADCEMNNVSCFTNSSADMPLPTFIEQPDAEIDGAPQVAVVLVDQAPRVSSGGRCIIPAGGDIQAAVDRVAAAGGGTCTLGAGVHEVRRPIVVPSNMEIAGAGAGATTVRSLMLDPEVMLPLCAWERGNCAVFTVNNISRENITIRDLEIDGGMSPEYVAHATTHCGMGGSYMADPCPPCTSSEKDTFEFCGWNNFGILLWDYNMPKHKGSPRNIRLSGLHVHGCSMGLHVLGTTNFSMVDSTFERNGNGNAYFHNAYFLRVVHSVLRNCSFLASTGHGLKITQQNDTLIEDCRIMDNRWQGIWVGQESAGNFDLRIRNCEVRRNHQYGIQLSETDGFEVTGCTIKHNPVASKAGLGILGSRNGVVHSNVISANANNLVIRDASNVTISNASGCNEAYYFPLCAEGGSYTMGDGSCEPRVGCALPETPF